MNIDDTGGNLTASKVIQDFDDLVLRAGELLPIRQREAAEFLRQYQDAQKEVVKLHGIISAHKAQAKGKTIVSFSGEIPQVKPRGKRAAKGEVQKQIDSVLMDAGGPLTEGEVRMAIKTKYGMDVSRSTVTLNLGKGKGDRYTYADGKWTYYL